MITLRGALVDDGAELGALHGAALSAACGVAR
jgi:hypothetical protein